MAPQTGVEFEDQNPYPSLSLAIPRDITYFFIVSAESRAEGVCGTSLTHALHTSPLRQLCSHQISLRYQGRACAHMENPACRADRGVTGMRTIDLSRAGEPAEVSIALSERLVVELPENPTTGYRWTVSAPSDDTVVALLLSGYRPGGEATGAGGTKCFVFEGKEAGTVELRFRKSRPWKAASIIDERILRFHVHKA